MVDVSKVVTKANAKVKGKNLLAKANANAKDLVSFF